MKIKSFKLFESNNIVGSIPSFIFDLFDYQHDCLTHLYDLGYEFKKYDKVSPTIILKLKDGVDYREFYNASDIDEYSSKMQVESELVEEIVNEVKRLSGLKNFGDITFYQSDKSISIKMSKVIDNRILELKIVQNGKINKEMFEKYFGKMVEPKSTDGDKWEFDGRYALIKVGDSKLLDRLLEDSEIFTCFRLEHGDYNIVLEVGLEK